ncbi:hypothetical protein [Chryseobacterium chendengshani]|uniref:hypothetical protein n=1 Tax=Chryseobacterium sp. LJ756 TaxID=2864113 RepID=UPI001C640E1C|nr:hypothetical protein [Chryseobacterium sp. LJ756]MBW7675653.1 hypothetical protein [Chryseobacterium sp. LJ756]
MKPSQTYWLIISGSMLSLIILLVPIALYVMDFHEYKRSTDPSDWGTFGDYLGGVLNPIISFLTLLVTIIIAVTIGKIEKKNHDETLHNSIKPFFVIDNADFFSSDVSMSSFPIGKNFYSYNQHEQITAPTNHKFKHFLKIENKGLGLATELQVTFKIDLNQLKESLQFKNSEIKITVSDIMRPEETKFVDVHLQHARQETSFLIFETETVRLGVVDRNGKTELYIPKSLMMAFEIHNYLREFRIGEFFPSFSLIFRYKNINEKALESNFDVALMHVETKTNFSIYRIMYRQSLENSAALL